MPEIDLWRCSLALTPADQNRCLKTLNPGELERAGRQTRQPARDYFIAARGQLRLILGYYLPIRPADLEFAAHPNGKPYLIGQTLYFNLSHSQDRMALAVSKLDRIGVDIEALAPRSGLHKLAQRCLSAAEFEGWSQTPPAQQLSLFYSLWTQKEAFMKAVGRGLALGLKECEFSLHPKTALHRIPAAYGLAKDWQVMEFPAGHGYAGALAAPAGALQIAIRDRQDGY